MACGPPLAINGLQLGCSQTVQPNFNRSQFSTVEFFLFSVRKILNRFGSQPFSLPNPLNPPLSLDPPPPLYSPRYP